MGRFEVRVFLVSLGAVVMACHDTPQAPRLDLPPHTPTAPSPFSVVTVQPFWTDYPTWMGVELLENSAHQIDVLSVNFDPQGDAFAVAACQRGCQQASDWSGEKVDSGECCGTNMGAVAVGTGIAAVVEDLGISFKSCPSDCSRTANWTSSTIFQGWLGNFQSHSHPLATDSSGTLHLIYRDSIQGGPIHYAECAGGCGASSGWHSMVLDSNVDSTTEVRDAALAVDPAGGAHVMTAGYYGAVRYFACSSQCLQSSHWIVATIDSAQVGGGPVVGGGRRW